MIVPTDCFIFGYFYNIPTGRGFPNSNEISPSTIYNGLSFDTELDSVETGQYYYVFLRHNALDNKLDIIIPVSEHEANGGLFKIVDNHVPDPSNIFGLGQNPTTTEFEERLNELVSNIKSWWLE